MPHNETKSPKREKSQPKTSLVPGAKEVDSWVILMKCPECGKLIKRTSFKEEANE